ncbi:hypothetical protein I6B53_10195 [Schaalia sp. 19OD2882]|nr:hypothetical protein [Schaalia sp. 19OD2882]QWW19437.1 hypothetical protein I6B53_10195 [Schaalia sp. 19OD2882]
MDESRGETDESHAKSRPAGRPPSTAAFSLLTLTRREARGWITWEILGA